MLEVSIRLAWLILAVIHVAPAAVLFRPELIGPMYGTSPSRSIGILLAHQGAAFLAVVIAATWAIFDPSVRRLCTIILAISVFGFLLVYLRAGYPEGSLRRIAFVDALAVPPLAWVAWNAWRR